MFLVGTLVRPVKRVTHLNITQFRIEDQPDLYFVSENTRLLADAFRESQMRRYLAYESQARPLLNQISMVQTTVSGTCTAALQGVVVMNLAALT